MHVGSLTLVASMCATTCKCLVFILHRTRPLFCSFLATFCRRKTVDFDGIQTRIVGEEVEHADHNPRPSHGL